MPFPTPHGNSWLVLYHILLTALHTITNNIWTKVMELYKPILVDSSAYIYHTLYIL